MYNSVEKGLKGKIKSKYSAEDRKAFGFCYLLLLIPVLQFAVFWLYVNLDSIMLAFRDGSGNFTLQNFKSVWTAFVDKDQYGFNLGSVLGRTVLLWTSVNVICTPLIMFSTYVLFKKIFGHYVFRTVFAIPGILGAIIWTRLMSFIVSANGPIISLAVKYDWGLPSDVIHNGLIATKATAFPTLLAINIVPNLVACNIILTGAFSRIPPEVFESARIDGASFIKVFFRISIPLAWPTIVVNFVSALATVFTADGNVFLYTMGNYDTATMGFYLYYMVYRISDSANANNSVYGYPAAVGLVLTLMTLPVILVSKHFMEKFNKDVEY